MNLQKLTIRARLTLAFATLTVLMLGLGALGLLGLTSVTRSFGDVMQTSYPNLVLANDIRDAHNDVSQAVRNLFIMSDPDDLKAQYELIERSEKRIAADVDKLKQTVGDAAGKATLEKLQLARSAYEKPLAQLIAKVKASQQEIAKNLLLIDLKPLQLAYVQSLDELVKAQDHAMVEAADAATLNASQTRWATGAVLVLTSVLALGLALAIIRSIVKPLDDAVAFASGVAAGDLTLNVRADVHTETGKLLFALQAMKNKLAGIVSEVRGNAEAVATGSAQIAQGNQDLSHRTEAQASALQETAASMEELGTTVQHNAESAKQASHLARNASIVASRGGEVVGQVVDTMKGIHASSKRIADIIGVIDGIAFQTNILALNAAVEAARAGDQGRGFAVVASEVRSLAQRSAEAAKEIKGLINTSVNQVNQGTQQVDEAGQTMGEVVSAIQRVSDLVAEISAASHEQSQGVQGVSQAVVRMDDATQQNAAMVEESAAAAESLRVQAQQLVAAVRVFKVASTH